MQVCWRSSCSVSFILLSMTTWNMKTGKLKVTDTKKDMLQWHFLKHSVQLCWRKYYWEKKSIVGWVQEKVTLTIILSFSIATLKMKTMVPSSNRQGSWEDTGKTLNSAKAVKIAQREVGAALWDSLLTWSYLWIILFS